ncbi:MAG: hypothetical protein RLY20_241 [Verrucomicrobiota bacterium]|jgi:hypothetical protein
MTARTSILKGALSLWLALIALSLFAGAVRADDVKFEAVLIWGTNDEKSPDPSHKPVSEAVAKKLKDFKWSHYFEVARKNVSVSKDEKRVQMSKDCTIVIKLLENNRVEVTLIGKGKTVGTMKKEMKKGSCLVTGGNSSNSTGWFIIIKQTD